MKIILAIMLGTVMLFNCVPTLAEQTVPTGSPITESPLAGDSVEAVTETGATANNDSRYNVYVYDADGNPVKGVFIQFCDDATCAFQPTDADGVATFEAEEKVYEVHALMVPEGYRQDEQAYKTLDTYSDVTVFLDRAE